MKRGCDLLILLLRSQSKDRSLVSLDSSYKDSAWPNNEHKKASLMDAFFVGSIRLLQSNRTFHHRDVARERAEETVLFQQH